MSVSCLSQLDWNRFFFSFFFERKSNQLQKNYETYFSSTHAYCMRYAIWCFGDFLVLHLYTTATPIKDFFSFRLMRRCYTFIGCFLILWIVFRYLLSQKEGMPFSIQYNRSESKFFSKSLASVQDPLLSFVAILNSLIAYLL